MQLAVLAAAPDAVLSPEDLPDVVENHTATGEPDDATARRVTLRIARELLVEVNRAAPSRNRPAATDSGSAG